jgi:type 1 fimbria pilin
VCLLVGVGIGLLIAVLAKAPLVSPPAGGGIHRTLFTTQILRVTASSNGYVLTTDFYVKNSGTIAAAPVCQLGYNGSVNATVTLPSIFAGQTEYATHNMPISFYVLGGESTFIGMTVVCR